METLKLKNTKKNQKNGTQNKFFCFLFSSSKFSRVSENFLVFSKVFVQVMMTSFEFVKIIKKFKRSAYVAYVLFFFFFEKTFFSHKWTNVNFQMGCVYEDVWITNNFGDIKTQKNAGKIKKFETKMKVFWFLFSPNRFSHVNDNFLVFSKVFIQLVVQSKWF